MAIELKCSCVSCGATVTITISEPSNDTRCPVCTNLFEIRNIAGYLYILSNSEMPGLLKIGQTTRSVGDRVAELNSATGVPAPFAVEAWFESADPQCHETELHKILTRCRLPNREFFRVTIEEAIAAARRITGREPAGSTRERVQDTKEQGLLPPSPSAYRQSFFRSKVNQFNFGVAYYSGDHAPHDYAEAARWFRKAAEQGHAPAQRYLGGIYYYGTGVPQDYGEAATWYRKAAEQGDAQAQLSLGVIYSTGQGIVQDDVEALAWYRRAAEQGDVQAQSNLGYAFANGRGVAQDYAEAFRWFQLGAESGNANAQYNLGLAYANGRGVAQDHPQAHMWIDLAVSASTGDQRKILSSERDAIAVTMTPQQVAEAERLAREWKRKFPK
jgi:TPR repeat protein